MKKTNQSGSRILYFALLWAIVYIGCLWIVKKLEPLQTLGIILSFLPVVTFVLFLVNYIKGIALMDEVERRIQLEAAVWAFTLSITLVMTLGLLDLVVKLNKEDWGPRHLVPYFFLFYFLGIFISKRKYHGS